MIEGLDGLLANMDQSGLPELRDLLMAMLGGPTVDGQLLEEQKLLRSRVYRLRFDVDGDVRSLIVKRFLPERARREQLAIQQWLPAVGLPRSAPILLGVAAAQGGQYVWHVYEDLGDWTLDKNGLEPGQAEAMKDCGFLSPLTMSPVIERVEVAVELIAQLHTRFADHALLAACRLHGGDLGLYFFTSSVRDAIRSLQSLRPPKVELSLDRQTLRNRLLQHLRRLIDEQPYRTETMIEFGGPDTLLHGDFSVKNTFVRHTKNKLQAQLIDWDHAGVGPYML
ncbi:aminoglycoside phosphotransferase family protein [Chloroflexi bacterium TSY]|nr:aminoglycoside phosphotransferase family protein [Chloroflexi bacterium TSY]